MASQQILFAETVASLKKALKRKAYESDSDDSIDHSSNRGQKLKKRARFTSQGQLAPPVGPEEVTFAGANRYILSRNPPLIDDDGFEVDSDDDEERIQTAVANAADINPYSDIRLEELLAPLTAVTDLPSHPTLSLPLTSYTIKQLATQASEMMRKEQNALWRARKLLTGLCGDFTWVPCGPLVGPNDIELYTDDSVLQSLLNKRSELSQGEGSSGVLANGDGKPSVNGSSSAGTGAQAPSAGGQGHNGDDVVMGDADASTAGKPSDDQPPAGVDKGLEPQKEPAEDKKEEGQIPKSENASGEQDGGAEDKPSGNGERPGEDAAKPADNNVEMQDADPAPQSNAKLNQQPDADNTQLYAPTPGDDEPFIHPFFTPPAHPMPDRDMGLPEGEAENVRHLMSLYVQKQEEICRGAMKLYLGLLRADQRREAVLKWAKAEAHVGELSDGEDWYDREEYGLSEDLKKGQDEEEEDNNNTTTTAKKTRNRRQ